MGAWEGDSVSICFNKLPRIRVKSELQRTREWAESPVRRLQWSEQGAGVMSQVMEAGGKHHVDLSEP